MANKAAALLLLLTFVLEATNVQGNLVEGKECYITSSYIAKYIVYCTL